MQVNDCENAVLEICTRHMVAAVGACRDYKSPAAGFVFPASKPHLHLCFRVSEFWYPADRPDNIRHISRPVAGFDALQYDLPHVFVAGLVYVDKRHAHRPGGTYHVAVNIGMAPYLNSLF